MILVLSDFSNITFISIFYRRKDSILTVVWWGADGRNENQIWKREK